ncbi:hypothetical protein [Mammaliicoccus sciuri]|uniref:hypothetical protein n=1 Tax=Mammaliicoccus sciuri TaxID=1296 RepID=UPI001950F8F5|nr:hypothetical protein [Mammaliicoccus sciuri]MEB7846343.1 hypothetical protein [Mammaliicoccus sciuri]
MKLKVSVVLLVFLILLTGCSQQENKDKNKQNDDKQTTKQSNKADNTQSENVEKSNVEDEEKENQEIDKEVEKITEMQSEAKKNAETYVDLAFSYNLGSEYKEYKDIFSKSMYNQLAKNDYETKEQDNRDKTVKEVNDIKIYFNEDEDIPKMALFTATYKIIDHKEKNIIQRNVTGEIHYVEEDNKIKIDGSQIIKTAENDDVNAYE